MTAKKQPSLFDLESFEEPVDESWRDEWKDMPEFVQEKQEAYATINVRFRDQQDLDDFAQRIGQRLTSRTKAIYHPQLPRGTNTHKWYVDAEAPQESEDSNES
jgi:hypothetical protein